MNVTDPEIVEYIASLEAELLQKTAALVALRDMNETLEDLVHRGAKIAGHIPYLCKDVEGSGQIEQAALQLHSLLVLRQR